MSKKISNEGQVEIIDALHSVGEQAINDGRFDDALGCLEILEHVVGTYQADPGKRREMLTTCKALSIVLPPLMEMAEAMSKKDKGGSNNG